MDQLKNHSNIRKTAGRGTSGSKKEASTSKLSLKNLENLSQHLQENEDHKVYVDLADASPGDAEAA